ncbi:32166_t:CDS:2, partial [Racocetra persica]
MFSRAAASIYTNNTSVILTRLVFTSCFLSDNRNLSRTRIFLQQRAPFYRRQVHSHDSHSHDHSHYNLALALSGPTNRGTKITLVGLGANVGLTVVKGIAGWMMNSASLVADAAHSLSGNDFVTLYTIRQSRKPPDETHPYGYGKYEAVGSLAVSSLLAVGAFGIGYHSYELLMSAIPPNSPFNITEISLTTQIDRPHLNPNATWFAAGSVVVKEALYRSTMKIASEEQSDILAANAWHHRSDAASSLVAVISIGGSSFGFPLLDPIGGILVAGMILKSGIEIMISSLRELVDMGLKEDDIKKVEKAVYKIQGIEPGVINFRSIRGRKSGPFYLIDMIVQVDPDLKISKARLIEEEIQKEVKKE